MTKRAVKYVTPKPIVHRLFFASHRVCWCFALIVWLITGCSFDRPAPLVSDATLSDPTSYLVPAKGIAPAAMTNQGISIGIASLIALLSVGATLLCARSRKKLRVALARSQALVDSLADAIIVTDDKGRIRSVNRAAVGLFGYRSHELAGENISKLISETDPSGHDGEVRRHTNGDSPRINRFGRELYARRKDGSTFPIDLSDGEMRLGDELCFSRTVRDISEPKAKDEKQKVISAEERLMALVARETDNAVIITDRHGHIVWANNGFYRMTEYALEEVIGQRPSDFLQGAGTDRSVVRRMGKTLQAGKVAKEEVLNYAKSGRSYWVQLQITPVIDENHNITHFVALEQDITRRRQTVLELQEAKEAAEDANRAKSVFLATMSHEIRTPMNGVVGMIDVLRHTSLNDTQRDLLGNIKESAFALLAIIDDILDLSKIEAGRLELERVAMSGGRAVETVCETVLTMARRKGIELLTFCDPAAPTIYADVVRLQQILFNLLGNAVKFAGNDANRPGRVAVSMEFHPLAQSRAELVLRVEDNGIGMSADTMARLFQPFLQGESSTTRRFGGTGLGLTICRRLVNMMGGDITVESREGEGSTFFVRLPCDLAPPEAPQRAFDLSGVNVLVLSLNEDELPRTILASYLTSAGASVTLASDEETVNQLLHDSARSKGTFIVMIDKHNHLGWAEMLRERIRQEAATAAPRFIMIARGRRRGFRRETNDTLTLDFDALRMETLLQMVATAAGRLAHEDAAPNRQAGRQFTAPVVKPPPATRPILVAEDNETNQKVFAHQIRILGYQCKIVENGRMALEEWRTGQYSLVLTDCHMPDVDGYDLARMIRDEEGETKHTAIIAVTADALKGTKERCVAAGMDDYLAKPIQLNTLQEKLTLWLPHSNAALIEPEISPVVNKLITESQVIDPDALTEVLGCDNRAVFASFYADFLRSGNAALAAVCTAYNDKQNQDISELAHRLKSAARTIGAHGLADCCLALEQAAKSSDWSLIDDQMARLPRHFVAAKQWIKNYCEKLNEH